MKVKVKRLLAVLCGIVMLCNSGIGLVSHAQEILEVKVVKEYRAPVGNNVEYGIYDIPDISGARAATLANCSIGIAVNANGVRGSIKTGSTVKASEIGIENIKLEKYENGKWVTVATHPGGSTTNDNAYVMEVTTNTAEKGVQYRLSCTHYAILEGTRRAMNNVTGGVSYND